MQVHVTIISLSPKLSFTDVETRKLQAVYVTWIQSQPFEIRMDLRPNLALLALQIPNLYYTSVLHIPPLFQQVGSSAAMFLPRSLDRCRR